MHDDQPTLPSVFGAEREGAPTWPGPEERARRTLVPNHDTNTLVLGVSLGANVVLLLAVVGLLVLGRAGFFYSGGYSTPSVTGTAAPRSALSSPTAAPSPSPSAGWLRVAPSSVQLGCNGDQQHQFVVLENTGPQQVQWQADLSLPANQAAVGVGPNQGMLAAGASQALQIQNQTHGNRGQGASSQQGVIQFDPQSADAGPAPSLTYTAMACP